jgi:hypothetical protein
LKAQVIDLNYTLTKFIEGKENLETLLGNQRYVFEKHRLGYNQRKMKKFTQFSL